MIDLQGILNGNFVFALGWTFVHSIWQFAVIGIALFFMLSFVKRASVRYSLSMLAQVLCFAASIATFTKYYVSISHASKLLTEYGGQITISYSNALMGSLIKGVNQHLDILIVLWIVGVVTQTIRLIIDMLQCNYLRTRHVDALPAHWQGRVLKLAERLKVSHKIDVKLSQVVSSPCVIGAFKPVILIPSTLLSSIPVQYIEAILLHELAHVKRHDYLINILVSFMNNLFFFNPVIWLIAKTVAHEREKSCDEIAVEHCESKKIYAQSLGKLSELNVDGGMIMAANKRTSLTLERIKSLFGDGEKKAFLGYRTVALLLLTLCGATVNAGADDIAIKKINYKLDTNANVIAKIGVSVGESTRDVRPASGISALDVSPGAGDTPIQLAKVEVVDTSSHKKQIDSSASIDFVMQKKKDVASQPDHASVEHATKSQENLIALATTEKKMASKKSKKSVKDNALQLEADPAPTLALEKFASLPDVSHVSLSPSGDKVVSLIRVETDGAKGTAIQVANVENGEKKIVLFNDNTKYFLYWVRWKDDKTLLAGYFYPDRRDEWLGFRSMKFDSRETRMLIIDVESGEVTSPFKKAFLKKFKVLPTHLDTVIDILPNDPEHILMSLPTVFSLRDRSYIGVFRVNLKNQRTKQIRKSVPHIWSWNTDQQHNVRSGHYYHETNGENRIRVQRPSDGKWLELWSHKLFSKDSVEALGFGVKPEDFYIRAYHNGLLAIFKVNLNEKDLERELVYADPKYDVKGELLYSHLTNDVIGITHSKEEGNKESGGYIFFDKKMLALQQRVDRALPKTDNKIVSFSDNMQKYLVYSSSDIESGTFYVGDSKKGSLGVLAYRYKDLTPENMASKQRYDYTARDGLGIEAYLTLPKGKGKVGLPTIIFPHGGPISRVTDGFDYWTQFFANRGYAVLQPNFRGSSGQGLEFRNAGLKNWGKEMQEDIEDGVKKLVDDGIADANSICIVGGSYGGYAALMGIVKTPDLYKCAISVNGVSNVYDIVKDNRSVRANYNIVDEMVGNDNEHLREISPVNYAQKVKVPVLLIHGEHDRQVDIKHSVNMRKALKKAGKDVSFLELPNEDHFLTNGGNRINAFKAMDAFLEKNLPIKD